MAITKDINIMELVTNHPEAVPVLAEAGFHCIGCALAQYETLEQGCQAHGIDAGGVVKKLNESIKE
ncbi:MAG: DUF1858 domain-containing protein [Candidatus Diapherotrites archaeon]|nr:DUF1858 domain-containing protein [Candidatus Diapherotrites archaeon]